MINELKLRSLMVRAGKTASDVAREIGISRGSLYNKIKGRTAFNVREMSDIKSVLKMSDKEANEIFFAK